MANDLGAMLTAFCVTILLCLAFGILVKIVVSSEFERWFGKKDQTINLGAMEGDTRHFNVSSVEDDKLWDDV